jgi:hypothetical protein
MTVQEITQRLSNANLARAALTRFQRDPDLVARYARNDTEAVEAVRRLVAIIAENTPSPYDAETEQQAALQTAQAEAPEREAMIDRIHSQNRLEHYLANESAALAQMRENYAKDAGAPGTWNGQPLPAATAATEGETK